MSSLLLLPTFYGFSLPTGADDVSIVEARLDPWHPQPLLVRFALRRQIRPLPLPPRAPGELGVAGGRRGDRPDEEGKASTRPDAGPKPFTGACRARD